MPLPELDAEQRRLALEKAAEARRLRAGLKQQLKAGEVTLKQVLDHADDVESVAKMRVSEVVESMPSYGKIKARRLMERLHIAHGRRLRGLGTHQRAALLSAFEDA